jgi:ubiquitin carboxyl-terminal hydrolase 8
MSPVASNGPPHSRGSSLNGGGPVTAADSAKVNSTGINGLKGANRVFLHLDDLLASKPNVDMNWPMRRLLQEGELLAKQADTHLDFRRPDVALQEYIKASIVAVELIPRHKDYPSLHSDRGDLHRLYSGLTKRINTQHGKFAEVKQVIKENNTRSGVKPTIHTSSGVTGTATQSNGIENGDEHAQSAQTLIMNGSSTNGAPPRKKPPVQPKPEALHGNAIHSTNGDGVPQADLAARFARLRTPEAKPAIQDPRIRTRPISIPGIAGSSTNSSPPGNYAAINRSTALQDLSSVPRTVPRSIPTKLDTEIPGMPKPPAAVYDSPIRGPESVAANLLSSRSSSYRISSREDSAPPISTVGPTPTLVDNRPDYFSFAQPAHTFGEDSYAQNPQKAPVLSDSPTVTAEELVDLLAQSSPSFRILLVDLRNREDFENGHIMSQFIICVEPITLKPGISGEQLGDSMVIAPDHEQNLYDQRHEFDLIVFYDQSSDSLNPSNLGAGETESTLKDFVSAIFNYGYDKRVKRHPKLLSGGLDAWVDILGSNSLKSSLDGASMDRPSRNSLKPGRPLSRQSMGHSSRNIPVKRRRTYSSRPLSKEEEKKWANALKEEHARSPVTPNDSSANDLVYARTTEDFFRRYPELPAIQESMTRPVSVPSVPRTYQDEFASVMPKPPARPAPALPRQRSSGISERGPIATYAHTSGDTITQSRVSPGLTGIENPNNLCYMNAAIQAMSATPFLRDLLMNYQHPPQTPIPKKNNETSAPPQLMLRCLGSVLTHLWSGQYDYVTPTTLRVSQIFSSSPNPLIPCRAM